LIYVTNHWDRTLAFRLKSCGWAAVTCGVKQSTMPLVEAAFRRATLQGESPGLKPAATKGGQERIVHSFKAFPHDRAAALRRYLVR